MYTDLRRNWMEDHGAGPIGLHEYVRDVLHIQDLTPLSELDAWGEVPPPLRDAILHVALLEKTTGRFPELETVGRIATEHTVRSDWVLLAFGWMPPAWKLLCETDRTVLRLAAAMDRASRTAH